MSKLVEALLASFDPFKIQGVERPLFAEHGDRWALTYELPYKGGQFEVAIMKGVGTPEKCDECEDVHGAAWDIKRTLRVGEHLPRELSSAEDAKLAEAELGVDAKLLGKISKAGTETFEALFDRMTLNGCERPTK